MQHLEEVRLEATAALTAQLIASGALLGGCSSEESSAVKSSQDVFIGATHPAVESTSKVTESI